MSDRPLLLDAFSGAGGAAMGYHRAGFDVVGVDHKPQPRYPFECWEMDALEALRQVADGETLLRFDAIHASPPCQAHSTIAKQQRTRREHDHPDLVPQARDLLVATGLPYVIENVVGAPLVEPMMICGSSIGLDVRRHRLFETNWSLMAPPCAHGAQEKRFRSLDSRSKRGYANVVGVHGHLNYAGERTLRQQAMEIDWMNDHELAQAIPPAYTELIGHQLLQHVKARVREASEQGDTT